MYEDEDRESDSNDIDQLHDDTENHPNVINEHLNNPLIDMNIKVRFLYLLFK